MKKYCIAKNRAVAACGSFNDARTRQRREVEVAKQRQRTAVGRLDWLNAVSAGRSYGKLVNK